MDELFEATFSPLASTGKVFSRCGKCRRYMNHIALRPQRLHCKTCNETYSLPQGGNIKLFKELKCPLDNFELVIFSTGSKGKGYSLCPHCYNEPPFEGVEPGMGCNTCPNKECRHSLENNWVAKCQEALCSGMMVFDETSAPRWKLCCNRCNAVASFSDSVYQMELVKDEHEKFAKCEHCSDEHAYTRLIRVVFDKKAGKENIEEACILCDEDIEGIMEQRIVRIGARRRGGGRGRGRGRRGRGRRSRGRG